MRPFTIVSDSSCDLPEELLKQFDIEIVPFYVTFDGVEFFKEKRDISLDEFFERIKSRSVFPKTSLPTISDYSEVFRRILKQGSDILCFCLTTKFSGSYQSAVNAKNILEEEFPEQKIFVIDSIQATLGEGLQVLEAAKLREDGATIEETVELVENEKHKARIYVTTATLEYLQRGGRIGKGAALAGSLLNVKPILCLKGGELYPVGKCRGMRKTLIELTDLSIKDLSGKPEDYVFDCAYSGDPAIAAEATEILKERHGISTDHSPLRLGITIGAHIGGDVLGIIYVPRISDRFKTLRNE